MRAACLGCLIAAGMSSVSLPSNAAALLVAPGIHVIRGVTTADSQPDGNSILIEAPDGLVVIDTGRHEAHTRQIVEFAKAVHQPVRVIVNSHWHLDHVGGNGLLRTRFPDAEVYASGAIRDALGGFLANYRKQLETALAGKSRPDEVATLRAEVSLIDSGPMLLPTRIVSDSGPRLIAGQSLEFFIEAAVTAGDVWVFDPGSRVLVAGDLITLPAPFFDTACPERWQAALDRLSQKSFRLVIPGHGAPMDRVQFDTYRQAFNNLLTCSRDAPRSKDDCIGGWLEDSNNLVTDGDRPYARSLLKYYLDNVLRGDATKLAAACASQK